ncbi:unnamed protein product [Adineta steineri]|uniref:G-protein coupled receptors family 1 profile domain-containing protein n=1 Tax=Adineta steineri TaxID=433720 RepID=A0A814FYR7_9BILA|nr:unnamed protein product [Adineta steineri]CAF0989329.1 unnamed protein product [Adineta steineri]
MNTTALPISLLKDSNTSIIINQSWFIPLDILLLVCLFLAILMSLLFFFIVLTDKTCHTVPIMLVTNSCFANFSLTIFLFWMTIITLYNDLQQIYYQDSFCIFRGYMTHVAFFWLFYSYFLQAIYSYITVIYPTRLFWQSRKFQFFLIILIWIVGFICACPGIATGAIKYLVDDQLCEIPFHFSIVTVYNIIYIYLIPVNGIIFIYYKLILYVREMNKRVTSANTLLRAQRELKMVFRIVILISILLTLSVPYTIFVFMGFFTSPLKYDFRIALTFVESSLLFFMIVVFKFTDPVRASIMKKLHQRLNVVAPIMT